MTGLLNAQGLPKQVEALGWTLDGWYDGAGWIAWRVWTPGGETETLTDRSASALLYKLELRNAEEVPRG